jgi:prepilin-type N-terminal cleavage/methylation domain-containing protein
MRRESCRAFSLLEMIAVLAVVAVVALIAIPAYRAVTENSKGNAADIEARAIGNNVLSLAIADESSPRRGPNPADPLGTYLRVVAAELTNVTLAQSTSFATDGLVKVTAADTSTCLTLPATTTGSLTVADCPAGSFTTVTP